MSRNHVCDYKTCHPTNNFGITYGINKHKTDNEVDDDRRVETSPDGQFQVKQDSIYLCNAGWLHICHAGGTVFSPCNIDFARYQQTGGCVCKITGKNTMFNKWNGGSLLPVLSNVPSADFFSLTEILETTALKQISKHSNTKGGGERSGALGKSNEESGVDWDQEVTMRNLLKRKAPGDMDDMACGVIDIKKTVLPFNAMYGDMMKSRCAKTNNEGKRQHKKRRVGNMHHHSYGSGFHSRAINTTKTITGSSTTTTTSARREGALESNPLDSVSLYKEKNPHYTSLGDGDRQYVDGLLKSSIFPSANFKEPIFDYFINTNVPKVYNTLFAKANQCNILGVKEDRMNDAETVVCNLLYNDHRMLKYKEAINAKRTECSTELAQLYLSQLKDPNNQTGVLNMKEGYDLIVRIMEGDELGRCCDFEPVLERNEAFIEYFKEMCWLQWCVVCASGYVDNLLKKPGSNGESETRSKNQNQQRRLHRNNSSNKSYRNSSSHHQHHQCSVGVNYVNNCIAVFFDMVSGCYCNDMLMIPSSKYVQMVAPPLNQLPDYGHQKKTYTNGTQQKNTAYCSIPTELMKMMCDFKFENWLDSSQAK